MGITPQPLKYQTKELEKSFGLEMYDFTARMYDPQLGRTWQMDPLASERVGVSPFSWVQNNPISRIDPTGASDEPVYSSAGLPRGETEEGFTGQVIIYNGDKDFKNMTKDQLLESTKNDEQKATTYDEVKDKIGDDNKAKIWSHILSKLEGTIINGERFSMKRLDTKVWFDQMAINEGSTSFFETSNLNPDLPLISGLDKHTYETTVENLQSTLLVHEWYTHGILKQGKHNKQHYKAYQNVLTHPMWNKTTDKYKGFNVRQLKYYLKKEIDAELGGKWLETYNYFYKCN